MGEWNVVILSLMTSVLLLRSFLPLDPLMGICVMNEFRGSVVRWSYKSLLFPLPNLSFSNSLSLSLFLSTLSFSRNTHIALFLNIELRTDVKERLTVCV